MKFLMTALGSHGDVLPQIAIGKALRERGHEVELFTSPYFAPQLEAAGLKLHPVGSRDDYVALLRNPDTHHPIRAFRLFADMLGPLFIPMLESMRKAVVPGQTMLIAGVWGVVARTLQETDGLPCVTLHMAPAVFRSRHQLSRMLAYDSLPYSPGWMRPALWRLGDVVLDPAILPMINPGRERLGLPSVKRFFHHWLHGADLQLGLFSENFGQPQPDWPANTRLTGFVFDDDRAPAVLPDAVEDFLAAGETPIGFTAGTATAANRDFFAASIAACQRAGRRGILLTHRPEQLPKHLPEGIVHFDYVPFAALLPRLAAFVHHGGIGSTAQALRAGVPQLIRPMAFDQFDNARRAERLGVAKEILPFRYRPAPVAKALEQLIASPDVQHACRQAAQDLVGEDGVEAACEAILTLAVQRLPPLVDSDAPT